MSSGGLSEYSRVKCSIVGVMQWCEVSGHQSLLQARVQSWAHTRTSEAFYRSLTPATHHWEPLLLQQTAGLIWLLHYTLMHWIRMCFHVPRMKMIWHGWKSGWSYWLIILSYSLLWLALLLRQINRKLPSQCLPARWLQHTETHCTVWSGHCDSSPSHTPTQCAEVSAGLQLQGLWSQSPAPALTHTLLCSLCSSYLLSSSCYPYLQLLNHFGSLLYNKPVSSVKLETNWNQPSSGHWPIAAG